MQWRGTPQLCLSKGAKDKIQRNGGNIMRSYVLYFFIYCFLLYTIWFCCHVDKLCHQLHCLASSVDGVGKDSIAVSVVQAVAGGKPADVVVAVAQILSASNLGQVSALVKVGGGLVLSVARSGQTGKVVVVQVTVGHVALGRHSVGQDVALAVTADIIAVVVRVATVGGTALLSNGKENLVDGVTGRAGG